MQTKRAHGRLLSTHRLFQVAEIADRAPSERVAFYCRAVKAFNIGNRSAGLFFTQRAEQWERIRVMADHQLMADADARAAIAKATGA